MRSVANITLRQMTGTPEEVGAVQRVLSGAPQYSILVSGAPAEADEAQSLFDALPPGRSYNDKVVFGIEVEGHLVGCIDVIRGFPTAETAHIGLLLLETAYEGKGIGSAAYLKLESVIGAWGNFARLRLAVLESNVRALAFWSKFGFIATGEARPHRSGSVSTRALVFVKPLPSAAA